MSRTILALTNTHSSSAVCTPSRYCILTGRYAWRSTLKESVLGGFSPRLASTPAFRNMTT